MNIQTKIEKKGYTIRCNCGYRNGVSTIVSYSAMKDGKEKATAPSKTALLKKL